MGFPCASKLCGPAPKHKFHVEEGYFLVVHVQTGCMHMDLHNIVQTTLYSITSFQNYIQNDYTKTPLTH